MSVTHSPLGNKSTVGNSNDSVEATVIEETQYEANADSQNINNRSRNKKRARINADSPLSSTSSPPSPVVSASLLQISEMFDQKLSTNSAFMVNLRQSIKTDLKAMIATEIGSAIQQLKDEFTETTDYITAEQKDINNRMDDYEHRLKELESENLHLRGELTIVKTRLGTVEKISRGLNVEMQAVPENRSENVVELFKTLCNSIDFPITDNDIRSCRRVAKHDQSSPRPRNILVTLTTPRIRESVLSAAYRYNKNNPKDKLNTRHLGITSETAEIYVTEHHSPEVKLLYAEARKFKKAQKYDFAWVKHGQVYVRKNVDSKAVLIKSVDSLNKLA